MPTKKYYENFVFSNPNYLIEHTRKTFTRTDSGKSWHTKPGSVKTELIKNEHYTNFVKSVPFFNGFCGGTCRGKETYTVAGYLVTTITSVSPDGSIKHIDTFNFTSFPMYYAYRDAGYREKFVLDNLSHYKKENISGRKIFTFYHDDGEHSAAYDATNYKWVN
jgi:hypothetical protein